MDEQGRAPVALKLVAMFKEFAAPKYAWLAFGLVIVIATAGFGGMNEATHPPAAIRTAPVEVAAAPFTIAITSGRISNIHPGYNSATAGTRYLVFTGTVVSTFDSYLELGQLVDAIRVNAPGLLLGSEPMDAARVTPTFDRRNGGYAGALQPGLAYDMQWYVAQSTAEPPPTSVTLDIRMLTRREDRLIGGMRWLDPTTVAQVAVPMEKP